MVRGGSQAALNGRYMHTMVWSPPYLRYAVTRLARYTPVPFKVTFAALKHITRYLYYHPHCSFIHPQMPMHGLHVIRNNNDSLHFAEQQITIAFVVFGNGDHGDDQCTRRSLSNAPFNETVSNEIDEGVSVFVDEDDGCDSESGGN